MNGCEKYDAALNRKKLDVPTTRAASTPIRGPWSSRPSATITTSDSTPTTGFTSHRGTPASAAPVSTTGQPMGNEPNVRSPSVTT